MSYINAPINDDTLKGVMQQSNTDIDTECDKNSVTQPSVVSNKERTDGQDIVQSTSHIVEVAKREHNIKQTKKPIVTKTRYGLHGFNY